MMTPERACKTLTKLRTRLISAMKQISRKRAWTPAEKACSMADYQMEIDAIDLALLTLNSPTLLYPRPPKLQPDQGGEGVA